MQRKASESRFALPEEVKEARARQLRERFAAANPVRPKPRPARAIDALRTGWRWWQWVAVLLAVLLVLGSFAGW